MRATNVISALLVSGFIVGCSTMPEQHSGLDAARKSYQAAQSDPDVTKHAAVELQQAGNALESAESAFTKADDAEALDHLAYIAKQRALIAQDTGKLKAAEIEIASVTAERDKVRLSMRTAEADAAAQQVATAQRAAAQKAEEVAAATAAADSARLREAEISAAAASQAAGDLAATKTRLSETEKELAELNAKKTERGLVITLGDVLFDVNKAELKPGSERDVQKLADFLQEYPERKALIEGFTDNTGSDAYNQSLSERRAEAVRVFLINKGVSRERVAARGYGEADPVASNDTPASRQLNRRVEIVVSDENRDIEPR